MKNLILKSVVVLSLLFANAIQAQSYSDPKNEVAKGLDKEVEATLVQQLTSEQNATRSSTARTTSAVYLRQVGFNNQADIQSQSNATNIVVTQNGNNNDVDLDYKVNSVEATVVQNGNGNRVRDYVLDKNKDVEFNLTQQGTNLTFDKFGSNSMTDKIEFTQTGANKTIIVRSFQ